MTHMSRGRMVRSPFDMSNSLCSPQPYQALSEVQVRRLLATEEEEHVRTGKKAALHDVSPASLLSIGLELEEQQYVPPAVELAPHLLSIRRQLHRDATRERSSNATKIFETRTALMRRIARFREIQSVYMPIVVRMLVTTSAPPTDVPPSTPSAATITLSTPYVPSPAPPPHTPSSSAKAKANLAENVCLLLPSDVLKTATSTLDDSQDSRTQRNTLLAGFSPGLVDMELRLRRAQCGDALDDLRTKLYMRTRFRQYKKINVRNQTRNMKANQALGNIERRIQRAADKYRAAREALAALVEDSDEWSANYAPYYLVLKPEDIRAFDADDPDTAQKKKKMKKGKKIAEGSRKVSWIWRGTADVENDGLNAGALCPYL